MIKTTFKLGGEVIEVIVDKTNLMFADAATGTITTIEGLKLSRPGVLKEHPDLEGDDEWKKKAMERLKEHIKKLQGEAKKTDYIIQELTKFGYEGLFKQRAGFRPEKIR